MQVYIYIKPTDVVLLSGVLNIEQLIRPEDLTINYSTDAKPNHVMVSLTADQFIWLQDDGILVTEELLLN